MKKAGLIIQMFLFSLVGNTHNENYFSINLSVEESNKQSVLINVLIHNNSSKTITIHSLRKECDNINVNFPWEIIIKQNENEYEYPIIVTGAGKFVKIKNNRSYHFVMCIDFEKLVKIDNHTFNAFTEEAVNTDYGEYEIILNYPNSNGQKIRSNLLKATYKK
jgi:hypothetical protein